MKPIHGSRNVGSLILGALLLMISACSEQSDQPASPGEQLEKDGIQHQASAPRVAKKTKAGPSTRSLEDIRKEDRFVILTRNAPTTYYLDRDGEPAGPEYDMGELFGEHLGVQPEYVVKNSIGALFKALKKGEGDMIAASISITPGRSEKYLFGPSYLEVTQQVVCRPGMKSPKDVTGLIGLKLMVVADSSYDERLASLAAQHPELKWKRTNNRGTEDLLEDVQDKKLDCTVADSNIVAVNRRYYPELRVAFNLGEPEHLAWVLPKGRDELRDEISRWHTEYRDKGHKADVEHRYYSHIKKFDYLDSTVFLKRLDKRYPKYKNWFEAAALRHLLNPNLLSSQGYQESHWDPDAESATGVRGIMMLTNATAKRLGVSDREDPRQSIFGGAKYLRMMEGYQSDDVPEPDRTWLALAAYNVGLGHLRDAQTLARRMAKDPYKWKDLETVLPLLSKKQYYKTLKYGYARGKEPVIYVQRIRNYQDMMEQALGERG